MARGEKPPIVLVGERENFVFLSNDSRVYLADVLSHQGYEHELVAMDGVFELVARSEWTAAIILFYISDGETGKEIWRVEQVLDRLSDLLDRLGIEKPECTVAPFTIAEPASDTEEFRGKAILAGVSECFFKKKLIGFLLSDMIVMENFVEALLSAGRSEEAKRVAEEEARIDPLTGVMNRRGLAERAGEAFAMAARLCTPTSLVIIDSDKFKRINDRHGHHIGDQVLIRTARLIQGVLKRRGDSVARWGGDEFVGLLENTSERNAYRLAKRIRETVYRPVIVTESGSIRISVSTGVATLAGDQQGTLDDLLAQADRRLGRAKYRRSRR